MARIEVRLQPRASSNEVTGDRGGKVTIRVTAAPVDGRANKALIKLVAARLGVAKSRLSIVRGETAREKLLEIKGLSDTEALSRLLDEI